MLKEYKHKDIIAKVIGGHTTQLLHKGGMKFRNSLGKKHGESIDETHYSIDCIVYRVFLRQPVEVEHFYYAICSALHSRKLDFDRKVTGYTQDDKVMVFRITYYSPFAIDEALLKRNKVELEHVSKEMTLDQLEKLKIEIADVFKPKGFDFNDFLPKS